MRRHPIEERSWVAGASAAVVLVAALVLAGTHSPRQPRSVGQFAYEVPMPPPHYVAERMHVPKDPSFLPRLLNDAGQVIGAARPSKDAPISFAIDPQVAVWNGQRVRVIPDLEGFAAIAFNNQGQALIGAAGFANALIIAEGNAVGAVIWSEGTLTPMPIVVPQGMNNKGDVVGYGSAEGTELIRKPYLWSHGKLTDITFGRDGIDPYSINDSGQIVGVTYQHVPTRASSERNRDRRDRMMDAEKSRGTIWLLNPGSREWERTHLLDNVPGTLTLSSEVHKLQINNGGQILVSLILDFETKKRYRFRALVWHRGRVREIGPMELDVKAESMNDAGQVVGQMSPMGHSGWAPFVWQGGIACNLNRLLVSKSNIKLIDAMCINNKGWILCDGDVGNQRYHYILRPSGSAPAPAASVNMAARPGR